MPHWKWDEMEAPYNFWKISVLCEYADMYGDEMSKMVNIFLCGMMFGENVVIFECISFTVVSHDHESI